MDTAQILSGWSGAAFGLSIGLLLVRLVLGLLMAAHGTQKLLGWFGGYGIAGTAGFFEQLGFRPGRFFATTAAVSEIVSGVLMALGLFGPVGPALMVSVMIVAAVSVHWQHGIFATSNGIELTLLYAAGAFALALTGPGRFSLDAVLQLEWLSAPTFAAVALGIGIVGGIANLAARRVPEPVVAPSPAAVPAVH
jgi:putative oxidoreductase